MGIDFVGVKNQFPLVDIVSRYVELRLKGSAYYGLCPFHSDRTPSFTVYQATDGWRWRCFSCGAGGTGEDVIKFIEEIEGLDPAKAVEFLTGEKAPAIGNRQLPQQPKPSKTHLWAPVMPVPEDAPGLDTTRIYNQHRDKWTGFKLVERQDAYLDVEGQLLCYVLRMDSGELKKDGTTKKICITVTYCENTETGDRRWCMKRPPAPYPIMGLDKLAEHPKKAVLVVSGEKCRAVADRENFAGYVAVSLMGGDGAVGQNDLTPLRGRDVTIWPDADPSGRNAALTLYNLLVELNSVRDDSRS